MSFENDYWKGGIALILFLVGIGILGWQLYFYLRFNNWMSISLITALQWLNNSWAYNPNDWTGIHTILKQLPLSLSMIVIALTIIQDS